MFRGAGAALPWRNFGGSPSPTIVSIVNHLLEDVNVVSGNSSKEITEDKFGVRSCRHRNLGVLRRQGSRDRYQAWQGPIRWEPLRPASILPKRWRRSRSRNMPMGCRSIGRKRFMLFKLWEKELPKLSGQIEARRGVVHLAGVPQSRATLGELLARKPKRQPGGVQILSLARGLTPDARARHRKCKRHMVSEFVPIRVLH